MNKTRFAVIIVAVLCVVTYSQRGNIALRIMQKALPQRMNADLTTQLPDGLHVALCGAGSPLPDPRRSGPCVAVIAGQQLFIVDAGSNGARNLNRMQIPVGKVAGVFLTHFHSDHLDGLGELATLRWVGAANTSPLPVRGPEGVEDIVAGFNMAYQRDSVYRNDHHGDGVAPLSGRGLVAEAFVVPPDGESVVVFEEDGVQVEMVTVDHLPVSPAVGYLFSYKDRSVLISGDTAKSANLEMFARGVDLLVHEALAPNIVGLMTQAANETGNRIMAKITTDILDYHASPVEAAEIARDAGVGHLLYYHVVPPLLVPGMTAAWLEGVDAVYTDYTIGQDGTLFSLPAGSKEILKISDGL